MSSHPGTGLYGAPIAQGDEEDPPRINRGWSFHDTSPLVGPRSANLQEVPRLLEPLSGSVGEHQPLLFRSLSSGTNGSSKKSSQNDATEPERRPRSRKQSQLQPSEKDGFLYYIIYALVNVIIAVPGLYGYAAVIFNHPVFQPHMNALSKLVIFSSLVHQLGFCLFSSLPFAIGTVQDAGLIFLSAMSNTIATTILEDGGTDEEIVSTTLVLLSLGTAALGVVLMLMGHFGLADAVSYLPMPVVGGYLAFIGYFCLQAGVALCISEAMLTFGDWKYLGDSRNLLLAIPGLGAGLLLTCVSRKATNPAALPFAMVAIPVVFYIIIFSSGVGIEGAREGGWVGEVAPPVPFTDLLHLADLTLVRWNLVIDIFPTWVGMVFVVSFASCLDVAAISMDMGEALDTNRELATVGVCNFMSGLTFGFTGSYIFSQTIFTYRTGVHSRWIGIFIMIAFMYVVISTVNILQVAPLFFLGSTLIFIGWDLLFEWLIEIRETIFLSEYAIVWATFIAIQVVGIDAGIVLGVLVAILYHVIMTAKASAVNRVFKRSKAVWTPSDYKVLLTHGYAQQSPKILTLEVIGSVFFGSSLQLLSTVMKEAGLDNMKQALGEKEEEDLVKAIVMSPHAHRQLLSKGTSNEKEKVLLKSGGKDRLFRPPEFVVLDLTQVPNLDASASRGCFQQLAKMCAKRGMTVCVAGACPRVDWMLRAHEAAYELTEEERIKAHLQKKNLTPLTGGSTEEIINCERILMFLTIHEALEFCENRLIHDLKKNTMMPNRLRGSFLRLDEIDRPATNSIGDVFSHILGLSKEEEHGLTAFESSHLRYHSEILCKAGDIIFAKETYPDAFFVVLRGAVAIVSTGPTQTESVILSGAGPQIRSSSGQRSGLLDPSLKQENVGSVQAFFQVGGVFGYVDFLLERPRLFRTIATQDNTLVAKISRDQATLLRTEDPTLDTILQRVLLQASLMDLANCACK